LAFQLPIVTLVRTADYKSLQSRNTLNAFCVLLPGQTPPSGIVKLYKLRTETPITRSMEYRFE